MYATVQKLKHCKYFPGGNLTTPSHDAGVRCQNSVAGLRVNEHS